MDYYSDYKYKPSTVKATDILSDFFLGTNKEQTKQQNQFNWEMFKEQNRFNEYMSNTSYQRGVADMEKAGINPMVAASSGGASTPTSAPVSQEASISVAQVLGGFARQIFKDMYSDWKDTKNILKNLIK